MSDSQLTKDKREFLKRIKEARIGDPAAQYEVALMYANGLGVAKDLDQALVWTQAAADKGNLAAQYMLGRAFQQGLGTEKDLHRALHWFLKAAERGYDKASLKVSTLYAKPQQAIALHYARNAAERGNAEAQLALGTFYERGLGVVKDLTLACAWYARAADKGLASAQYRMGLALERGAGLAIDLELARNWYREAAGQGLPAAQLALARLDNAGYGRVAEKKKAGKRLATRERRAADSRWIKFASKGNEEDFYHLGIMFESGIGVESSTKQARLWYRKAAELGHVDAMVMLAKSLVQVNVSDAADWYLRAAELGHAEAQRALADTLAEGSTEGHDLLGACNWYVMAARQGDVLAKQALSTFLQHNQEGICDALVRSAAQGGLAQAQYVTGLKARRRPSDLDDGLRACEWFRAAAEQGHADAQCELADCFAEGRWVKKDRVKAFHWYEKAALQGHARAQWNLGELYAVGIPGVAQDPSQATLLCKRAAKAGFAPAQATMGTLMARAKKHDRALEWWTLAAEQGDLEAQFNLAYAYRSGMGVEKNEERALMLLMAAANSGLAAAQARLGLDYAQGNFAVLDLIESAKWFIMAADNGDHSAMKNKERSRTVLSPAQWAEAERRARLPGNTLSK
jgi:TPR repeat protein